MKFLTALIILMGVSFQFLFAQEEMERPATQAAFVEIGGPGLPYSFNYDFRFNKNDINSWGMRVGFGGFSLEGESFFTVPVMANKLFGKGRHFFELGLGATFIAYDTESYEYQSCYTDANGDYICTSYGESDDSTYFILEIDNSPSVMGVLNFGYRRMPVDGGFIWKANLNPIFNNHGFWPLFAGVGIGYAF